MFVEFNKCDYVCDNRPLRLYGEVPSSVMRIFSSATPAYGLERQKFGRNVSMKTIPIFNDVYESEDVDEFANGNPILFSVSDGDEELNDNEIKVPIVAL